jgi:hypothetical protein
MIPAPGTAMTPDAINEQFGMLLRDQPPGTTADITDYYVAFWDGQAVVGVILLADEYELFGDEFYFDDYFCQYHGAEISAWFAQPRYTRRAEVLDWITDAPPHDFP